MTPELDLFGEVIPTYDTRVFTPTFFKEMNHLIDAGQRCRDHHEWLKAQASRWSSPVFEKLGDGYVRTTFWKE